MADKRREEAFVWTDRKIKLFVEYGNLNADEEFIWRTRLRGYTVTQQCEALTISPSTAARMIAKIKRVYDAVQKEYPEEFPVRKENVKIEKFMDEN